MQLKTFSSTSTRLHPKKMTFYKKDRQTLHFSYATLVTDVPVFGAGQFQFQ